MCFFSKINNFQFFGDLKKNFQFSIFIDYFYFQNSFQTRSFVSKVLTPPPHPKKFWHPGAGPKSQPPLHTPHALWTSNLALSSSQQYQKREGEVWRGRRFFYLCFTQKIFCAVCGFCNFCMPFLWQMYPNSRPCLPSFFHLFRPPHPKTTWAIDRCVRI